MSKKEYDPIPIKMQPVYDEITKLSDAVCRKHLDEEYAELARLMAAALARKRPSPLARGRKDIWAAAIVYSLGSVNFLFDKSQVPHMRAGELSDLFGVSQKTAANKSRQIWDILEIYQAEPKWWRPSKMEENPLAWWVMVNGLAVDARKLPLEIQEHLAQRKLIPFVPRKHAEPKGTRDLREGNDHQGL